MERDEDGIPICPDPIYAERDALRARVAELETKHPEWMKRIQRERKEAVALAIDAVNTQLREHGFDIQFDPAALV
jgi:hypothetical protein